MGLTVEQKINMLILAGYEPRVYHNASCYDNICIRILAEGVALLRKDDERTNWEVSSDWRGGSVGYALLTWDRMRLESCPDEIIYQAVEAANGR